MKIKRNIARMTCAALVASAALIAPWAQGTAQAATADCTKGAYKMARTAGYEIYVPVTSGSSENCQRGPHSGALDATNALQSSLYICYNVDLGDAWIDGIYGSRTIAGVKKAQRAGGVADDGVYGKNTHNAMKHIPKYYVRDLCALAKKV